MKPILLCAVLLLSSTSFAAPMNSCEAFSGGYSKQPNMGDTYDANGIEIVYDSESSLMQIKYNSDTPREQWNGWIEIYVADGASHKGDGPNTGSSYTVTCQENQMKIVRYGMLVKPLIETLTLTGDQLYFLNYIEGNEVHATHMQLKKVR